MYLETISMINLLTPDEILLHDGSKNRILSKKIEIYININNNNNTNRNNNINVLYISRQYFDQDKGAELLKKIIIGDNTIDSDLISKYTVLAGSYCLLRYIENVTNRIYGDKTLRLLYINNNNILKNCSKMIIDRKTINNLELLYSNNIYTTTNKSNIKNTSLYDTINNTKTVVGSRLLKSNLIRPSMDILTINTRLDIIELLLKNNNIYDNIINILIKFPDLEKMLNGLVTTPKTITPKTSKMSIDTLIYLKEAFNILPLLSSTIELLLSKNIDNNNNINILLNAFLNNINDINFNNMKNIIDLKLIESTKYSKNIHEMRHEECFAVRPGINGILDVNRKTFLQCVEDIYKIVDELTEKYNINNIKVTYTTMRGYFLSIPINKDNNIDLPDCFIQAVLNKRTISCSTEDIISLSDRASEAMKSALIITNEIIQDIISTIQIHIDSLFSLVDTIALIDMLCAFADLVALCPHIYTRPIVKEDGQLIIKDGRHPVISVLGNSLKSSFIGNNTYISPYENVLIITGANGSGKTVYIKQVAIICILTQIGCFVPCQYAEIPLRDRILSRICNQDDLEHNLSTFTSEMRETSYIISNLTSKSLIIIDELGRGTSNIDGLSIAFSVCEYLISSSSYTLFVTHYPQLTYIPLLYTNTRNIHFKTTINSNILYNINSAIHSNDNNQCIVYSHQLQDGPCDMMSGYGLVLAEVTDFPNDIIIEAKKISKIIIEKFPILLSSNNNYNNNNTDKLSYILKKILSCKYNIYNNESKLCELFTSLRQEISDAYSNTMIEYINDNFNKININKNKNNDSNDDAVDALLSLHTSSSTNNTTAMEPITIITDNIIIMNDIMLCNNDENIHRDNELTPPSSASSPCKKLKITRSVD